MTITRTLGACLSAGLLALSLAACGGSDDPGTGTDTTPTSASAGTSTSTDGSQAPAADLDLVSDGTLTVCSDVPYPPFEDFDSSAASGYQGFDIDIVEAIADSLGLTLAVKDSDFTTLQSGVLLNSGACDLGASAMTITPEREKNILFSDGYYDSQQSLLVPVDSDIASIDDLAGKKVGVQKGTTGESYTAENAPDADAIQFADDGKMYLALKAGQIDAILQDLPVNLDHQNDENDPGKFKVVQTFDTDEEYGLAAKKDNTALIDDVNEQLTAMKSDGSYQTIYDKYFKVG